MDHGAERHELLREFERVRGLSMRLVAPLAAEDWRMQPMPDVSPPFWNVGHTSWFFARNVLPLAGGSVAGFDGFDYAFNSYYESLGPRLPRDQRGRIAEPRTGAVLEYRAAVDAAMARAIRDCPAAVFARFRDCTEIGMQHEQQHQELFCTEILHIRWSSPAALRTAYLPGPAAKVSGTGTELRAVDCAAGTVEIGHRGGGFCWDNELPMHRRAVGAFGLGDRLITNREWLAFVGDRGYERPLLWLDNGWQQVKQHGWQAPLYWRRDGGTWTRFSLRGEAELQPEAPVTNVSFYEAEAFARWFGEQSSAWRHARLPRECEWEAAARVHGFDASGGNLLDDDPAASALDARPAASGPGLRQLAGDLWEWTLSHYEPYPGYRPFAGDLMEYNGKFMDNQRVLRGGSYATPRRHARVAYRNFWPAATRFQATGVRLLVDR